MNKFIYFYSPLYKYYDLHLKKFLSNYFNIESYLIDDLKAQNQHTFLNGVSIKIEIIIERIKENLNSFIIFTDATLFVNSKNAHLLNDFFDSYKKYDITFADNNVDDTKDRYNIGIMLINCNDKTLLFFENVLKDLKINRGWDQRIVNNHLKFDTHLSIGIFDNKKIWCEYYFNKDYLDTFYIFKSFISHTDNSILNYNSRIQLFYNSGLIEKDEYLENIKKCDKLKIINGRFKIV
jgi:hypothetical protein